LNQTAPAENRRQIKMKNNDTELRALLQEWRVTAPLPPRFNEQVWKRIERADVISVSVVEIVREWLFAALARPKYALAYVTALLLLGSSVGLLQANQKAAHWERELQARYVQSIDPYHKGRP
jgi:hypothetical protein